MANQTILKTTGEKEEFSKEKLKKSIVAAGAEEGVSDEVVKEILKGEKPESTDELRDRVYYELEKEYRPIAARYNLKEAITEFGPTGYPFETFIGELFKAQGYKVKEGVIMEGKCLTHEVDLLVEKDNSYEMVECKFHARLSKRSDAKVPLYINSRYLDLVAKWKTDADKKGKDFNCWIVTNTRFSKDARQYSKCVGINLLSWEQPAGQSLVKLLDKYGVHPMTAITQLTFNQKEVLAKSGIVLCRQVIESKRKMASLGFSAELIDNLIDEAQAVINLEDRI